MSYAATDRDGNREYKSKSYICKNCPVRERCTQSQQCTKTVTRHVWRDYIERAADVKHSAIGRETCALRSQTIERVFADAKEKHAMRYTPYRGLIAVTAWVKLKFAAMNIQIGAADAYIAAADVKHYRSDMDRFVPLMEKFRSLYGFYPEYPAADAGYGSYNNCLYCEAHGMKKHMKLTMFDKESRDRKDRENPYRSETAKEPFDSGRGYVWRYEIRPKLQTDRAQRDRFRQT